MAMHIKVTPTNNTFSVDVVDEDGNFIDGFEDIEADAVEHWSANLKKNNYDVQSYLEEILQEIETSNKYLYRDEEIYEGHYGLKMTRNTTWHQHTFKRTINGQTVEVSFDFGTGDGHIEEDSGVLETVFDDSFSVLAYSDTKDNVDAMGSWAEDLDFASQKNGIAKAVKAWNGSWEEWAKLQQLFTADEIANVKHAFEEGRRR